MLIDRSIGGIACQETLIGVVPSRCHHGHSIDLHSLIAINTSAVTRTLSVWADLLGPEPQHPAFPGGYRNGPTRGRLHQLLS